MGALGMHHTTKTVIVSPLCFSAVYLGDAVVIARALVITFLVVLCTARDCELHHITCYCIILLGTSLITMFNVVPKRMQNGIYACFTNYLDVVCP